MYLYVVFNSSHRLNLVLRSPLVKQSFSRLSLVKCIPAFYQLRVYPRLLQVTTFPRLSQFKHFPALVVGYTLFFPRTLVTGNKFSRACTDYKFSSWSHFRLAYYSTRMRAKIIDSMNTLVLDFKKKIN